MRKILDLSVWMMNPNPQHTKAKKSSSPLNTMKPNTAETGTQVQVTRTTTTQATIETQTISNPELLPYTDEEMVGHYTDQLFQCEHAAAADTTTTSPASEHEDQTQTFTCCVCLDTLNSGDKNTTLTPCGHAYHLSCLLSSLRTKNSCPMCRGSLEDPRPKPSTTNTLRPSNAEQIIRDELYWFPKSAHILNIRGSNHPKRAFKDSLRTFAYAVLQTTAEFVHAENVPEEWYSDDDTDDEESGDDNSESSENTDNEQTDNENEQTDNENEQTDNENEQTDNQDQDHPEAPRDDDGDDEFNYAQHANRTRGVNPVANTNTHTRISMRLRSSSRRSDFDLRNELP
jgi:hypothetical protein